MKKIFVFIAAMILVGAYAFAQWQKGDERNGFGLGVQFYVGEINKPDGAEDSSPFLLAPRIFYRNSTSDETWVINTHAGFFYGFTKEFDQGGNEVNPKEIYFDLDFGYRWFFAPTYSLSFFIYNLSYYVFSPELDGTNAFSGYLEPYIRFTKGMDFGDLYAQAGYGFDYIPIRKDSDFSSTINLTAGVDLNLLGGFGRIEATMHNSITPDVRYNGFDVILRYERSIFCALLETSIAKYFDYRDAYNDGIDYLDKMGINIYPELNIFFRKFSAFVGCSFDRIGFKNWGEDMDVAVTPYVGFRYIF